MAQRLCKVCGAAAEAGETRCGECGAPLPREEPAQEPISPPAERIEEADLPEEPLFTPRWRRMLRRTLAVALCAAALGLCARRSWPRQEADQFAAYEGEGVGWLGSTFLTPRGAWTFPGPSYDAGPSAGRDCRLLVYQGEESGEEPTPRTAYAFFNGEELEAHTWRSAALSGNGKWVFYVEQVGEEQILFRRELSTGQIQELDRGELEGLTVAWDGSAALYQKMAGHTADSFLWTRREGARAIGLSDLGFPDCLGTEGRSYLGTTLDSAAISFAGSQIYQVSWGGEPHELGQTPIVDREVEEVIFRGREDDRWYYESARSPAAPLDVPAGCSLSLCRPQGREGELPARLTDWLYQCIDGEGFSYFYLGEDLTPEELELPSGAAVTALTVSRTGERAVCLSEEGEVYLLDRSQGGVGRFVPLVDAGGAVTYLCAGDVETLYYETGAHEIYAMALTGEAPEEGPARLIWEDGGDSVWRPLENGGLYLVCYGQEFDFSGPAIYYTDGASPARRVEGPEPAPGMWSAQLDGMRGLAVIEDWSDYALTLTIQDKLWYLNPQGEAALIPWREAPELARALGD